MVVDQLKAAVPERPRLAPGVRLAGQMKESAFVDPPWLVERQGDGYVQVPRPLYRLAERADGQHTLDDLADFVAQTEGLPLSSENVRRLIARQLIPNGIVPTSDGRVVATGRARRSALAIARLKTIDPRSLAGVAGVLQALFWPPVLVAILVVAAVTQGWLYFVHGVGGGLHDAFYVPGFMFLVLAVIVLSAGFHELGHAAALRYAGGHPRSFGFGMYLMYPVFFTDVSDNYRLRRWARVRTDLGGFYFNLVVALAMFVVYVLTRQEGWLVLILLMNFEVIRQLLPFVRLDGYWTLADLTGIPDFFSQMGAFLRTTLPFAGRTPGRKLPPLKWWGKAVFLGYTLVTVPALVLLSFLMLRSVPRVLASVWDALGQQGHAFMVAQAGGDVLGMAGACCQSLLLILPVGGLLFALERMLAGIARWLWRWSASSRSRRALVAVAAAGFLATLYALWMPEIPWPGTRPNPLYQPDTWRPIGADERLTVGDALAGTAVVRSASAELPNWLPGPGAPGSSAAGSGPASAGSGPASAGAGRSAGSGSAPAGPAVSGSAPAGSAVSGPAPADLAASGSAPAPSADAAAPGGSDASTAPGASESSPAAGSTASGASAGPDGSLAAGPSESSSGPASDVASAATGAGTAANSAASSVSSAANSATSDASSVANSATSDASSAANSATSALTNAPSALPPAVATPGAAASGAVSSVEGTVSSPPSTGTLTNPVQTVAAAPPVSVPTTIAAPPPASIPTVAPAPPPPSVPGAVPTPPAAVPTAVETVVATTVPVSAPTPPAALPTPPASAPTPPVAVPTPPVSAPTPPAALPTAPASAPTPPAAGPTPPVSAPTPPAALPTAPASAPTPPVAVSTPPAAAPSPAAAVRAPTMLP